MPPNDDDDRPRRKPRPRDEDDDDNEEDDDRPRRRRNRDDERDKTGGLIPYKNGKALAAYYCGVFSLIPLFGCVLSVFAVVLGVMGIVYANQHPAAKGKGHAITGIVLAIFGQPLLLGLLFLVVALANKK